MVFTDDLRYEHTRLDGHGLVDDALLLRVVAHFHVAGEREVLAERMADEAVVREEMRRRSGWPRNRMPYRSNASRSNQFALAHTSRSESITGSSTFSEIAQADEGADARCA